VLHDQPSDVAVAHLRLHRVALCLRHVARTEAHRHWDSEYTIKRNSGTPPACMAKTPNDIQNASHQGVFTGSALLVVGG
jgi:hypothetical protein